MAVHLSREERDGLESIVRRQPSEAREYRRARIVLLAASGASKTAIAGQLGTNRQRVGEWLRRFEQDRLEGLSDQPRSGRPTQIAALERHQVIATACRSPREFDVERNVWSHQSLRDALLSADLVREISTTSAAAILDEAVIKPHRVKMWCHSSDPDYQKKMRAIVRLYVRRPKGEPVLCIDEKTGMQALSRARDLRVHHAMRTVAQVRKAFDMMCERVLSRKTKGELLANKQMVQEQIADSWIEIEQFRLLVLRTAWRIDKYKDYMKVRKDIAAVKVAMAKVMHDVVYRSMHIHGALGVTWDMPLVTMWQEVPILGIADGPDEVHKVTIARQVLRDYEGVSGLWPSEHVPTKLEAARKKLAHLIELEVGNL